MLKSNGRVVLTREDGVRRAMAAAGSAGFGYKLGHGGRAPESLVPYSSKGFVDCSGFTAWACGYDRFQNIPPSNEEWINTDWIVKEATGSLQEWFHVVPKTDPVLPGDLLVYPGHSINGEWKYGHVGMITYVHPGFKRGRIGWWLALSVAHATPSHRRKYGNVVAVTDARIWRKKGYIVRYRHWAVN